MSRSLVSLYEISNLNADVRLGHNKYLNLLSMSSSMTVAGIVYGAYECLRPELKGFDVGESW